MEIIEKWGEAQMAELDGVLAAFTESLDRLLEASLVFQNEALKNVVRPRQCQTVVEGIKRRDTLQGIRIRPNSDFNPDYL